MSTPQVNPQEVFRATLPLGTSQIVIFVPSLDREGKSINQDHSVDQILTTLGYLFRGATAYPRGRGLEHLAEVLAQIPNSTIATSSQEGVRRLIQFNPDTWKKLEQLAQTGFSNTSKPVTASELAAAIIEQAVANTPG